MKKLSLKDTNRKRKENPTLVGLSEELKSPEKFEEIEKKLFSIVQVAHKHKTAKQYVSCDECNKNRELRNKAILDYGFKDYNQYLLWKKVQQIIKSKQNFQIR